MFIEKNIYEIPIGYDNKNMLFCQYITYRISSRERLFKALNNGEHSRWCLFAEEYLDEVKNDIIHHQNVHQFYE